MMESPGSPRPSKSWKVNFGVICKMVDSLFKNLLATESVNGTNACDLRKQIQGHCLSLVML